MSLTSWDLDIILAELRVSVASLRISDDQFESALASGDIRQAVTRSEELTNLATQESATVEVFHTARHAAEFRCDVQAAIAGRVALAQAMSHLHDGFDDCIATDSVAEHNAARPVLYTPQRLKTNGQMMF